MTRDVRQTSPAVPRAVGLVATSLVLFAVFLALALYVWHDVGPLHFDSRVADRLPRVDAETREFIAQLSFPGRPKAVVAESLLVAAIAFWQTRRWRVALFCACVPIVVGITAETVLKPLIDRRAHRGAGLAFPSGHTTGITSVAAVAWLTVVSSWRSMAARLGGAAVLVAVVSAVAVSRVWVGSHYATDVIGGVLFAVAATLAVATVVLRERTTLPT